MCSIKALHLESLPGLSQISVSTSPPAHHLVERAQDCRGAGGDDHWEDALGMCQESLYHPSGASKVSKRYRPVFTCVGFW